MKPLLAPAVVQRNGMGWLVVLVAFLGVVACQRAVPPGATPTPAAPTATAVPPTATAPPSPTRPPTPTPLPPAFVLWLPPGAPREAWEAPLRAWLEQNAPQPQWRLLTVEAFPQEPTDLLAVFVVPGVDIEAVLQQAAQQPQRPFLVLGAWEGEDTVPENVLLINTRWLQPRYRAFMAGYLAALLSPNWRVVYFEGPQAPEDMWPAFWAGVRYMCGMCRPPKPPVEAYPVRFPVAAAQPQPWVEACRQARQAYFVEVAYLVGQIPREAEDCLREAGAHLLGDDLTRGPVTLDVALRSPDWGQLLNTYGPRLWEGPRGVVVPPLRYDVTEPEDLPPGRMEHLQLVWQDVVQGYIFVPESLP